ncbi:MAG: VanW family protein [Lachnospiraceae bacterium]|nr:VanW family protein [Lachnospiraceae bacterium]
MKKWRCSFLCLALSFLLFGSMEVQTFAKEEDTILPGIYVEEMSLEGKTASQAEAMVNEYVGTLSSKSIKLVTVNDNEVTITPSDIGFYWSNKEIIDEAAAIGQKGNVVQRYKMKKDLQFENKVFELEFDVDKELLKHVLADQCSYYNVEAKNATLSRVDEQFVIEKGQIGCVVDEEASASKIVDYLTGDWDGQDAVIELVVATDEPLGTEEELSKVTDVLGTFSTSFSTSGKARSANVRNGCDLINGVTLYPGEEFSTYDLVSPFSEENGYYLAGSYLNGQVVDSLGGGICQVSTTLYNAVLLAELEITERHNHSMIVTYVDPSADAAISESAGKDFRFVNSTDMPIYIDGYTTDDKQIVFTIYGVETRPESHRVSYESEIISKTYPDTEVIYTDESLPIGSISVQSAHIGYKANLWKIVYENEQEVSREMVNSSVYKMVPRYATVGTATQDPNAYNQLMEAIATNNIDHVKNVVAALTAAPVTAVPADPNAAAPAPAPADPNAQPQAAPAPPVQ